MAREQWLTVSKSESSLPVLSSPHAGKSNISGKLFQISLLQRAIVAYLRGLQDAQHSDVCSLLTFCQGFKCSSIAS